MRFKEFIPLTFVFLVSFGNWTNHAGKKTIMAVFAHPDDEMTVGPLLAKLAREGHQVNLVIATKGELGIAPHANIPAGDTLAFTRAKELHCACQKLGINPPVLLELGDGSLTKDFTGIPLRQKLDSVLKLYKPDIVITWGPDGGYGHMDHRMVHNVVTELFQSGELVKPEQLYYTGIPTENWKQQLNLQSDHIKRMSGLWKPVKKAYLTTRIRCNKDDIANAQAALQCHQSQFSQSQMNDIKAWLLNTDTAYLRPFIPKEKITFSLFP